MYVAVSLSSSESIDRHVGTATAAPNEERRSGTVMTRHSPTTSQFAVYLKLHFYPLRLIAPASDAFEVQFVGALCGSLSPNAFVASSIERPLLCHSLLFSFILCHSLQFPAIPCHSLPLSVALFQRFVCSRRGSRRRPSQWRGMRRPIANKIEP